MISKPLETIEDLSSNENYNNFRTTITKNSRNNDSKIPRPKNTHLAPTQWDILSTTSDTTTKSDSGRLINVVPNIYIEEQLREVRLQKDAQFKYQNTRDIHRLSGVSRIPETALRKEKVRGKA